MTARRKAGAGRRDGLTVAALQRVRPRPRAAGYVDPRTQKTYTAGQVARAKRAAGWTPQITAALKAKGFGASFADQVATTKRYRAQLPAAARRKRKDPAADFARTAELALRARDSLAELVDGYRRHAKQQGRAVSATAAKHSAAFWRAVKDLHAARSVTRDGKEIKVGKDSKVARALVTLGLRPSWATWRVGDSPSPERLSQFLGRKVLDMTDLTPQEYHRVDDEVRVGGKLARPTKTDPRPAETAAMQAVGKRSPLDSRGLRG